MPQIPPKKEKDIFEQLYELLVITDPDKLPPKKRKSSSKDDHSYETYDFLEGEYGRLAKLNTFFSTKIPNALEYSQTQRLVENHEVAIYKARREIIQNLKEPHSFLQRQLQSIWKQAFH